MCIFLEVAVDGGVHGSEGEGFLHPSDCVTEEEFDVNEADGALTEDLQCALCEVRT